MRNLLLLVLILMCAGHPLSSLAQTDREFTRAVKRRLIDPGPFTMEDLSLLCASQNGSQRKAQLRLSDIHPSHWVAMHTRQEAGWDNATSRDYLLRALVCLSNPEIADEGIQVKVAEVYEEERALWHSIVESNSRTGGLRSFEMFKAPCGGCTTYFEATKANSPRVHQALFHTLTLGLRSTHATTLSALYALRKVRYVDESYLEIWRAFMANPNSAIRDPLWLEPEVFNLFPHHYYELLGINRRAREVVAPRPTPQRYRDDAALIAAETNLNCQNRAPNNCRHLSENFSRENFRRACRPTVAEVKTLLPEVIEEQESMISGSVRYFAVVSGQFKYYLSRRDGMVQLRVPIHINNWGSLSERQRTHYLHNLKHAEILWEYASDRFTRHYTIDFLFEVVPSAREATVSARLVGETNGPYFSTHDLDWTGDTLAHEVGHMLGLHDEYAYLTDNQTCEHDSAMCTSASSPDKILDRHLYVVLRRAICLAD